MKRRILSLLLAVLLTAALPVTALAVNNYTDLTGHWAASYILELSDLGYLTGYTDGTVRPEGIITANEALVLLSRFYDVDDAALELIHDDYGDFVESNVDVTLRWAYDELELCLAAGILSENELRNLRLTAPIEKELLSVLLVRALQKTDEADALVDRGVELDFSDTDEIAPAYRGHIAVLVDAGIVEGNSRNEFLPHAQVTRGVVAAMIVRSLDYLEDEGDYLALEGYTDVTRQSGILVDYGSEQLTFRGPDGIVRRYPVAADADVTVQDGDNRLDDNLAGSRLSLRLSEGQITAVTVQNRPNYEYVQGRVSSVARSGTGYDVRFNDADDGKSTRIRLPRGTDVTINDRVEGPEDLEIGMYLTVTYRGDDVSEVSAVSGNVTVEGTVSRMTYGTPAVLEVTTEDGGLVRFDLDLTNLPDIYWGENSAGIDRVTVGSRAELTVRGGRLTEIGLEMSDETLDGIVTSIVSTTGGTTWMITDEYNNTQSLTVSPSANAYQNGKAILVSAVQVGDTVSVVVEGSTIVEIYLVQGTGSSANKVSGTVLAVDDDDSVITLLNTSNRLIYLDVRQVGAILESSSGTAVPLAALKPNEQIVAYGSYVDAANFRAASIIWEN